MLHPVTPEQLLLAYRLLGQVQVVDLYDIDTVFSINHDKELMAKCAPKLSPQFVVLVLTSTPP